MIAMERIKGCSAHASLQSLDWHACGNTTPVCGRRAHRATPEGLQRHASRTKIGTFVQYPSQCLAKTQPAKLLPQLPAVSWQPSILGATSRKAEWSQDLRRSSSLGAPRS